MNVNALVAALTLATTAPVHAGPYALAAYRADADLPAPPLPEAVAEGPNPWLAAVSTGLLGYVPFGALVGYAYVGDLDRGWRAVRRQGALAGAGALVGLVAAPIMIANAPLRGGIDGNSMDMLLLAVLPTFGAVVGHEAGAIWAAFDAYDAACNKVMPPK